MRKLNTKRIIKVGLIWVPTLPVVFFFTENALTKIIYPHYFEHIVSSKAIIILVGLCLLTATALFLYKRTIMIGAIILASYMTIIVFIHIAKDKPYFLTLLIILLTIFGGYIRKKIPMNRKIKNCS